MTITSTPLYRLVGKKKERKSYIININIAAVQTLYSSYMSQSILYYVPLATSFVAIGTSCCSGSATLIPSSGVLISGCS